MRLTVKHIFYLSAVMSFVLIFCFHSASFAVNKIDYTRQIDNSEEYIDDAAIDDSEMELIEKSLVEETAKNRFDIKKDSSFSIEIANTHNKTADGVETPIILALNESHKAAEETNDKSPLSTEDDTEEAEQGIVADPIEPINRVIFDFNDMVYFNIMKPFYKVYNSTFPEEIRIAGRNFFDNIAMPVRFVSCAIQIKPSCAGIELARFAINTTAGIAGIFDIASGDPFHLKKQEADIGLAFGYYGIGEGFYLVLPFMGPSSLRDTIGMVGDSFLTPTSYIEPFYIPMTLSAVNFLNRGSLVYTEYEDLKKSSIDPYAAFKDAYIQYRRGKIKK